MFMLSSPYYIYKSNIHCIISLQLQKQSIQGGEISVPTLKSPVATLKSFWHHCMVQSDTDNCCSKFLLTSLVELALLAAVWSAMVLINWTKHVYKGMHELSGLGAYNVISKNVSSWYGFRLPLPLPSHPHIFGTVDSNHSS